MQLLRHRIIMGLSMNKDIPDFFQNSRLAITPLPLSGRCCDRPKEMLFRLLLLACELYDALFAA